MEHEIRCLPMDRAELRVEEDGQDGQGEGKRTYLSGYAALFNSLSEDLGGFRERIAPGAFRREIESGADVVLVPDHRYDAAAMLGRTTNKTLRLSENDTGLRVRATLPDTTAGRDIAAVIKRGDVHGMSFAFSIPDPSGEAWSEEGGIIIRELRNVRLFDVSVVVWPAYPATSVNVAKRCLDHAAHLRAAPQLIRLQLERERLLFY